MDEMCMQHARHVPCDKGMQQWYDIASNLQPPQMVDARPHQRLAGAALSSCVRSQGPIQVKEQYRPGICTDVFVHKVSLYAARLIVRRKGPRAASALALEGDNVGARGRSEVHLLNSSLLLSV